MGQVVAPFNCSEILNNDLPESIMASLDGRSSPTRRDRVKKVLDTLVATGAARTGELEGQTRYFVAR